MVLPSDLTPLRASPPAVAISSILLPSAVSRSASATLSFVARAPRPVTSAAVIVFSPETTLPLASVVTFT